MDDTLKIVVVGNEGVGKSCFVKHLIASGVRPPHDITGDADAPADPSLSLLQQSSAVRLAVNEIFLPEEEGGDATSGVLKKVQIWDFKGGQQFHSLQEVFYTPQTLYVVVWDMAAKDVERMEEERPQDMSRRCSDSHTVSAHSSAFKLGYDSDSDSDNDCDMDLYNQEEVRRSKRALEMDIDQKVQFWIDRIEMKVPGATIVPVATCADQFVCEAQQKEAKKRLKNLKERMAWNEERRIQDLERRLKEASERDENDHDIFRWIKLLSNRPKILFRPQGGGKPDLPCFVSNVCSTCNNRDWAIDFIIASSRALVREQALCRPQLPAFARVLQETCRRMKAHFKVVQTSYFAQQFSDQERETDAMSRTLESLHRSGEICYFGGSGAFSHSPCQTLPNSLLLDDFVITDPSWLVESVDYILRLAMQNDGMNQSAANPLEENLSNCPSIRKDEIRMLWKNRSPTVQGLELAEQISNDAASDVFDFLEKLLVQNDIFVPLTFGNDNADSSHFFVPSLLWDREVEAPFSNTGTSSEATAIDSRGIESHVLLADSSDFLSNAICHGLVFMDSVPTTFMERIMIHVIKGLGPAFARNQSCCSKSCKYPRVRVNEFQCSKKYYRIKLSMDLPSGEGERNVEVQSFLLEAPDGSAEHSGRSGACQSMYVTCIQGCSDPKSCDFWREICTIIRTSMQQTLDEIPGLEYRDEGVCPECLSKRKPCGEVGTWSFAKLRSVICDGETVIRCRQGHCIETKFIGGLVNCQLDSPDGSSGLCRSNCCGKPPSTSQLYALSLDGPSLQDESVAERRGICEGAEIVPSKNLDNSLISSIGHERPPSRRMSNPSVEGRIVIPKPSPNIVRHITHPVLSKFSPEDESIRQKLNVRIEECELNMKKRFFGRKKFKLDLSNFGLAQCHLPVAELYQTSLGLHLQSLTLANNRLDGVPEQIVSCLPNLTSLDLSHNTIFELPKRWSLPNLKKLKLSHNLLVSFPSESMLLGLLSLEELNLSDNKLKSVRIPSNPEILGKLKSLDLSMNELTSLPKELSRLRSLKVLDVQFNSIEKVPEKVVSSMNSFLLQSGMSSNSNRNKRKNLDTKIRRGIASLSSNSSCSLPQDYVYSKPLLVSRETHATVPVEEQGEY